MPLLYSFVARGHSVLAHCNPYRGNFEAIALDCLTNINNPEPKFTVEHNSGTTFNFIHQNGYTFLVVADGKAGRTLAFACLEIMRNEWEAHYGRGDRARLSPPHGFDALFGPRMQAHMEHCTSHPEEVNKLAAMQQMVGEVSSRMRENVVLVMQRGVAFDRLHDKAMELEKASHNFRDKAEKLRCHMCVQYYKMWVVAALVLCVLIVVIFLIACFSGSKNCTKHHND